MPLTGLPTGGQAREKPGLPLDRQHVLRTWPGCKFLLRAASAAGIGALLALWQEAAENSGRPADRPEALEVLPARDADAVIAAEDAGKLVHVWSADKV